MPAASGSGLGVYFWAGSVANYSGDAIMGEALSLAKSTGVHVVRIYMGAQSDQDYQGPSAPCIINFTLTELAQRPDFNAFLTDTQFTTVIITAYDGAAWGTCGLGNATFSSPVNTTAVSQEYAEFATYLNKIAPSKTFILANWEGDNAAYCGSASDFMAGSVSCKNYGQVVLNWLTTWFNARHAGIHSTTSSNVFDAIELSSVNSLKSAGLPSVLYDLSSQVHPDYYSYSCYESLASGSTAQLAADLATIRSVTGSSKVFIGELGFNNQPVELGSFLSASLGVPYTIVWGLLDNPPGFGLFNSTGAITPSGSAVLSLASSGK